MSEYSRVSDKICKSAVIDDISTGISNAEKEISDVYNNMTGLDSPRSCFLYGDSISNFENLILGINQSLVKLREKLSYFETGFEDIENSSSQQINEIEIPSIHSAELHNIEFSTPTVSTPSPVNIAIPSGQQNPTPENSTISSEQQTAIPENPVNQETIDSNIDTQIQFEENNTEPQVMSNNLQNSDEGLIASSNEDDLTNNESNFYSDDSFDFEFKENDELSSPEVNSNEEVPISESFNNTTESLNNQKVEKDESSGGFNGALVGGIAAAIGAVGAGAAFAYSNMKKNEEKDDDSRRGE